MACWLAVCTIPLAFTDLAVSRQPDPLTAAAYAGTAVLLLLAAATGEPGAGGHGASWPALLRAALGGLGGAVLLASRRVGRKQLIPFGPFMIAGTFLVILAAPV